MVSIHVQCQAVIESHISLYLGPMNHTLEVWAALLSPSLKIPIMVIVKF